MFQAIAWPEPSRKAVYGNGLARVRTWVLRITLLTWDFPLGRFVGWSYGRRSWWRRRCGWWRWWTCKFPDITVKWQCDLYSALPAGEVPTLSMNRVLTTYSGRPPGRLDWRCGCCRRSGWRCWWCGRWSWWTCKSSLIFFLLRVPQLTSSQGALLGALGGAA